MIKLIWEFIMSLFQDQTKEIIDTSKDKVICRYTLIDNTNGYAEGSLYFNNDMYKIVSGPYGKGYAPKGKYKAYSGQLKHRDEEAYSQFGFGWCLPIGSQFETDRTGLMLHPDGNVKGSLGCIVFQFEGLDENVHCYNSLRDYFERSNILNVEVV